jgi:hypothetical protein
MRRTFLLELKIIFLAQALNQTAITQEARKETTNEKLDNE